MVGSQIIEKMRITDRPINIYISGMPETAITPRKGSGTSLSTLGRLRHLTMCRMVHTMATMNEGTSSLRPVSI